MGDVIPFPAPRRRLHEPAALDRLIAEVAGPRHRSTTGDDVRDRPPRPSGTVVPFRLADR